MPRLPRWSRSLSFLLVVVLLCTSLAPSVLVAPPAVAAPVTTAPRVAASHALADVDSPIAPPAWSSLPTPPDFPTPPAAPSIDYLRQLYGTLHAFEGGQDEGGFDGDFNSTRTLRFTEPGPVSLGDGIQKSVEWVLSIPPGTYNSIVVDHSLTTNHGLYSAKSTISIRPVGTSGWTHSTTVGDVFPAWNGGFFTLHYTDARFSLGRIAQWNDTPLEVRLRCYGEGKAEPTCSWSNVRFYTDAPGWQFSEYDPLIGSPGSFYLTSKVFMGVYDAPYQTIESLDGPFLAFQSTSTARGVPEHTSYIARSPVFTMPERSPNDTLTIQLQSAVYVPGGINAEGARIQFISLEDPGQPVTHLFDLYGNPRDWALSSSTIPAHLAGKRGQLRVVLPNGSVPRTIALDSITILRNGEAVNVGGTSNNLLEQTAGKCACNTCASGTQNIHGDPVNTCNGILSHRATDLALASSGPPLELTRTYISLFADTATYPTTALGPGWRHSLAHALTLPDQAGGEAGRIIYEAPSGNRLRFAAEADGSYTPDPGVYATLVGGSDTTYTMTLRDATRLWFDNEGRLRERATPTGARQTFQYHGAMGTPWDGQLETVTDVTTGRSLTFAYLDHNGAPRLATVQDSAGRQVNYTYTPDGDLATVTDVRGGTTTYAYANHLLTSITDPSGVQQMHTAYGAASGRVIQQVDAAGLTTTYDYASTATGSRTTITQQRDGEPADVLVDHYRADGTLEYQERNGQMQRYTAFDANLARSVVVDGSGQATRVESNAMGLPRQVTNALGQTTQVAYNALNQPAIITDTLGRQTTLAYDAHYNLVRLTTGITDAAPLGFTTVYTYDVAHPDRMTAQQSPDGVVTTYAYDTIGQLTSSTSGAGTPDALTTAYEYDSLGRVAATTVGAGTPLARRDVVAYNPDNTVERTIQNYVDGTFDAAQPDEDVTTTYGYDALGQQTWVRDAAGRYDATHTDARGQVDWRIRNLVPFAVDAHGQPLFQPFDPAQPDQNVATFSTLAKLVW